MGNKILRHWKNVRIVILLIWVVLLICLCLSSWEVKAQMHTIGRHHHLFHVLAFAATTMLLAWNGRSLLSRAAFACFAVVLAFTTEWLEAWKYHNPFEWVDISSDCQGIFWGVFVVIFGSLLTRRYLPDPST